MRHGLVVHVCSDDVESTDGRQGDSCLALLERASGDEVTCRRVDLVYTFYFRIDGDVRVIVRCMLR